VKVIELAGGPKSPGGARYGSLVHAVLATVPLRAESAFVEQITALHARILGASTDEVTAAIFVVEATLKHDIMRRAAKCERHGHCRREVPVTLFQGEVLIEGVIDLAFEEPSEWTVVDFKTDEELETHLDRYKRQVAFYADAVGRATQKATSACILRV